MLAMSEELALAIAFTAVVFLVLTFLIVLAVRSVPNKPPALALLIPAIALAFLGAICIAIGFVAKLVKSDNKDQPQA